jgi:phosphoheptose isomerase
MCKLNSVTAIVPSAIQAVLSTLSNNYSFEKVFWRQIEALGRPVTSRGQFQRAEILSSFSTR